MGTWGTGPYESDSAGEWLSETLVPPIEKALKKGSDADARVAAAALTDYLGKHESVADLVDLAIERLEDILEDEDYVESFTDPAAAKRAVKSQIRKLRKMRDDLEEGRKRSRAMLRY